MNRIFIILMVLVFNGCTTNQSAKLLPYSQAKVETLPGLVPARTSRFASAVLNSSLDINNFNSISFSTLNFDELVIDERSLEYNERGWAFTDKEKLSYQKYLNKQINKVFDEHAAVSSSDTVTDSTLILELKLLNFVPRAPKDNSRQRFAGERYFTRGVGSLSLAFVLRDATTNDVVAIFEDEQEVGDEFRLERNDRVNNRRFFKIEFRRWLKKLDDTLAELQKDKAERTSA